MRVRFAENAPLTLADEPALAAFAADFAVRLRPGDIVALGGPLGSGKTTFVRAVVRALHGSEHVTSPTFTFWHHYGGEPPIDHLDLYRVERPSDVMELGLDAAFCETSIVLVEWWRNAPDLVVQHRYEIELAGAGDEPRILTLRNRYA